MNKQYPYHKKQQYSLPQSFRFALQGVWFTICHERNFRIHLCATAYVAYFAARYYTLTRGEIAILILTIAAILSFELINTAIEKTVDLITPDFNVLAKIAKDVAAGAVFVGSLGSVLVGLLMFWNPPIFRLIFHDIILRWYIWVPLLLLTLIIIILPEILQKKKK